MPTAVAPGHRHWRDCHLRFHRYDLVRPSPDIGDLLREIDHGPIAIFWG